MNQTTSANLVRSWVATYTDGLPVEVRDGRRDEIESDLWSQASEAAESGRSSGSLAGETYARLLLGIPSDLSWRFENLQLTRLHEARRQRAKSDLRVTSALAIGGGAAWSLSILLFWATGSQSGGVSDPIRWIEMMTAMLATWAMAGALIGLTFAFQEYLRAPVALFGTISASIGALAILGAYVGLIALPLGSALIVWQLSRIRVFGSAIANVHVAVSLLASLSIFEGLTHWADMGNSWPLLFVAMAVYGISWATVGWSVRHGVTLTESASQR